MAVLGAAATLSVHVLCAAESVRDGDSVDGDPAGKLGVLAGTASALPSSWEAQVRI
jgi:hypothetical protein